MRRRIERWERWEAKELLEEGNGKEMLDFRRPIPCGEPIKAFLLDDGKVIQIGKSGAVFADKQHYFSYLLEGGAFQIVKHVSHTLPRKGIEYLPGGDKVYYFEIPELEGRCMRSVYEQLNKADFATDADEVYIGPDGDVIEYKEQWSYPYRLFQSMSDYQKLDERRRIPLQLKGIPESIGKYHDPNFAMSMCGRNPYGKEFPNMAKELAERLPTLINAPEGLLTFTDASFPKLEKHFYRQIITADFADNTFLPLLAYMGLTLINEKGGEWEMLYRSSYDSWSPYVVTKNGQRIQLLKGLIDLFDWQGGNWSPFKSLYSKLPPA